MVSKVNTGVLLTVVGTKLINLLRSWGAEMFVRWQYIPEAVSLLVAGPVLQKLEIQARCTFNSVSTTTEMSKLKLVPAHSHSLALSCSLQLWNTVV